MSPDADLIPKRIGTASSTQGSRRWSDSVVPLPWFQSAFGEGSEEHLGRVDLGQLLDLARIIVWEADQEGVRLTHLSPQAVTLLGYPLKQWNEPNFLAAHIHPDDRERVLAFFNNPRPVKDCEFEFRLLSEDLSTVWLRPLMKILPQEERTGRLRGFMIDITAQRRAEERLQELGGRLITAQEEERSRVARELHDDVNQRMALLSIELEQLRQDLQKPVDLLDRFQNLQTQVLEISTDIHRLSHRLHPSKLDHLGLEAAVRSLCVELSESEKLQIEFQQQGFPAILPRDVTLCIFRVAQEALRNCVKHSGAQSIEVLLEKSTTAIRLSVSDNGCGFDPLSEPSKKGLGFVSMRERLHLVGGEMRIDTAPLKGTRIQVLVPVSREAGINEVELKAFTRRSRQSSAKEPMVSTRNRRVSTSKWRGL